jgi:hypothetical protein
MLRLMGEFMSKSSRLWHLVESIDGTKQPSGGRHSSMKSMVRFPAPHQGAVLARAEEGRVHRDHAISTDASYLHVLHGIPFCCGLPLPVWSFLGSLSEAGGVCCYLLFL